MSILEEGRLGEQWAMRWLSDRGLEVFEPDWIARDPEDGRYFNVEVKVQEAFEPPPFFGHGLPPRQIASRLRFHRETGIRTLLLVREKASNSTAYWQWLDTLDIGVSYDTHGSRPRRIYPLEAFNKGVA